ncbi:hypothetical protein KIN20_033912 [Parelaphostrongylus tenuis]|uniref:Uncharacterized protein n=1 Tax=Parelaphostrongylus tenuis TaxID=148309 RepID=A0AAD5RBG5_PARTN|nr:hypothetical protein KIN20_033912 [Parelaphostrongylus tenuis]
MGTEEVESLDTPPARSQPVEFLFIRQVLVRFLPFNMDQWPVVTPDLRDSDYFDGE